jgi:hypothetical protein
MKMHIKPTLALVVTLASSAAYAQTPREPAEPITPAPVTSAPMAAPVSMPAPAAAVAPVSDIVPVATAEVTVQLHPVTRFGTKKQMFLGGASGATFAGHHLQLNDAKADEFLLSASTSFGTFAIDNLAYGLKGAVNYGKRDDAQSLGLQVGPFIGYNVPIHHHLSFFPTLAALYVYGNGITGKGASNYNHEIDLQLELTIVAHIAEHLSFTISPYARQSVYNHVGEQVGAQLESGKGVWSTLYGVNFGILGWY